MLISHIDETITLSSQSMLYYSLKKRNIFIHSQNQGNVNKRTVSNPKGTNRPASRGRPIKIIHTMQPMKQMKNCNSVSYACSKKLILNARASAIVY